MSCHSVCKSRFRETPREYSILSRPRSADEIAKAFIPHYYNLFDTNREGLVSLFRETSTLTFEGDGPKTGCAQIMEKLRSLPPACIGAARFCAFASRARWGGASRSGGELVRA